MDSERIRHGVHAGVESAPRALQRLGRLQHHRELHEIEALHEDQRTGAPPRRDLLRMEEGVETFAQHDGLEAGRQVERGRAVSGAEDFG